MRAGGNAPQVSGGRASLAILPAGGAEVGGCTRGHWGRRRGQTRASPAGGRARPGHMTPCQPPRPRVWGSGDGVVARCRRPRRNVGGKIGWRLGRRAALGRQYLRNPADGRLARFVLMVTGPDRADDADRLAAHLTSASRWARAPRSGTFRSCCRGPGAGVRKTCPCPLGTARPRYGSGVQAHPADAVPERPGGPDDGVSGVGVPGSPRRWRRCASSSVHWLCPPPPASRLGGSGGNRPAWLGAR